MNFLTSVSVSRCNKNIWGSFCCQESPVKPFYITMAVKKRHPVIKTSISQMPRRHCVSLKPSGLILWTQVRFQADYPKFHRDIKHPGFDDYRKDKHKDLKKTTWHSGDEKQGYINALGLIGCLCGMYGLKAQLIHYLSSMGPPADVIALASIEIDISNVAAGSCSSFKWRGKPLFVKHRTPTEIAAEANTPLALLKDPETPEQRTQKPEWLIVIGICTHLGCVPVANSGDWAGGFYCPCHGSHYDNVGRARKGPAPTNLEVPPYKFITDTLVLVG